MAVITDIEDLRLLARRRVPRMFYEYLDAGSWTESTYRANARDLQRIKCVEIVLTGSDRAGRCRAVSAVIHQKPPVRRGAGIGL